MIGDWDCQWFGYGPDGKKGAPINCNWRAYYTFANQMVQDDFVMKNGEGQPVFSGTTLRTHSQNVHRWELVFLAA